MGRVTNEKVLKEISYIKGKLESSEGFAKEHRTWEVAQVERLHKKLDDQNGRLGEAEKSISWLQGIAGIFTIAFSWLFKRSI